VVTHFSTLDEFEVRAITRSPNSPKAQALAALPHVTLVTANMSDSESLARAFRGAEAVFAITNYYDEQCVNDRMEEARQGCRMADVAATENIERSYGATSTSAVLSSGLVRNTREIL
jgi:uncharacterized protein YbjT (DUF2867 family)